MVEEAFHRGVLIRGSADTFGLDLKKVTACVKAAARKWMCAVNLTSSDRRDHGSGATVDVICDNDTCMWDARLHKGEVIVPGGWARLR